MLLLSLLVETGQLPGAGLTQADKTCIQLNFYLEILKGGTWVSGGGGKSPPAPSLNATLAVCVYLVMVCMCGPGDGVCVCGPGDVVPPPQGVHSSRDLADGDVW